MIAQAQPSASIRYRRLSFAVVYQAVLFPFDPILFVRALAKNGWVLNEQVDAIPMGVTRVDLAGKVAGKGDVSVRLDTDKKIVAVDALAPRAAIEEFNNVERMLRTELDVDSPSIAFFYEFTANLNLRGKRNPLEVWAARARGYPFIDEFSRIIGQDAMPFGIRLSRLGESPNRPDWFELRLEPSIQNPTTQYWVEVVFRKGERAPVSGFAESFEDRCREMLAAVEVGA